MRFTIGKFDPATGTVPVVFKYLGKRHERAVNACLDEAGIYDPKATAARVGDVANGVAHKIDIGVVG